METRRQRNRESRISLAKHELIQTVKKDDLDQLLRIQEMPPGLRFEDDVLLYEAARAGSRKVIPHLLFKGLDLERGHILADVPLLQAAISGHWDTVKLLLGSGARYRDVLSAGSMLLQISPQRFEKLSSIIKSFRSYVNACIYEVAEEVDDSTAKLIVSFIYPYL